MAKRVLLAMSGGVDSSAAALLLLAQGYDVTGVTYIMWDGALEESGLEDARSVCSKLGVEHHSLDCRAQFRSEVVDYFISEYMAGRTPNPCVACNRYIKFAPLAHGDSLPEFDFIATGHYVRTEYDDIRGRHVIKKAAHLPKDQSYVLYTLTQGQLSRILTPLGGYTKAEARAKALQLGADIANKRDSTDICFIPGGDYCSFLEKYTRVKMARGFFIDTAGNVLGKHKGLWRYTVGQRRGLGISLGEPLYVREIDARRNTVMLARGDELYSRGLIAGDLNYVAISGLDEPAEVTAKIRYSHREAPATLYPHEQGVAKLIFKEPQRAVTRGQSVVFYDGDTVVGGGIIENIIY